MGKQKTVKIYDKNGNSMQINESIKSAFIGKGFYLKDPTQKIKGDNDGR